MLINKVYKVVVYTGNYTMHDLGLVFGSEDQEKIKEEIRQQYNYDSTDRISLYDKSEYLLKAIEKISNQEDGKYWKGCR